jgi:hypothetical protein
MATSINLGARVTVLVGCLTIAVAVGCSVPNPVAPTDRPFPSAPSLTSTDDVDDGTTDCPPDATSCDTVTTAERQSLWWDVQQGVKWWDPDCAAIGYHMQDKVLHGDIRKFPTIAARPWVTGSWQPVPNVAGADQISFRSDLWSSAWTSERLLTAIHEGVHSYHRGGSFDHTYAVGFGTYWAEDNCFNY